MFRARVKLRERTFRPYVMKKTVEGVSFDFYVADIESSIWNDTGDQSVVWQEMRFIRERLAGPGDVVLDCGAHHGVTALVFSSLVGPAGKVIAFEPHPHNVSVIRKNLSLNAITNVAVEQYALGGQTGTVYLRDKSNASVAWRSQTGPIAVDLVTLDEYVARTKLVPTFLKIDVEGYEAQLLRGAKTVLRGSPKLAIEVHSSALPRYGDSVRTLFDAIPGDRYDMWVLRGPALQRLDPSDEPPADPRYHVFALPRRP